MAREDPALTRHVNRIWSAFDELLDASDDVALVREHPGWKAVQSLLQAEIDAITAQMEGGGPLEQAEYAWRHGRIGGLKAASGAIDAIVDVAYRRRQEQSDRHEATAEIVAGG